MRRSPLNPVALLPPQQPVSSPPSLRGGQALPDDPAPCCQPCPAGVLPARTHLFPGPCPSFWPRDPRWSKHPHATPSARGFLSCGMTSPTSTSRHIPVPPSSKKTPGLQGWVRGCPGLHCPCTPLTETPAALGTLMCAPLASPATPRLGLGEERRLVSLHS